MAQFECNSCKGIYTSPLPDGSIYMHRCPDERVDADGEREPIDDPRDENLIGGTGEDREQIRAAGTGRRQL